MRRVDEVDIKCCGAISMQLLLVALLWLVNAPGYSATRVACPVPNVTLFSDQAEDGELACQAVGTTLAFMRSQGFRVDAEFTIDLVDRPLSLHGTEVTGTYDSRSFHIKVPNFKNARLMALRHPPFRMRMCRTIWQSFVAHEVAHAVAHANFQISKPSLEAHEYIAYVVQLATLPQALRQQLLEAFDQPAFQHERQISRIFLQLAPEVFGVKAYRHYAAEPDPQAFFQRLLNRRLRSLH
ncbi:hypothetical protein DIT71_08280 [Marinobacter vulgaris]|uniref:Uncharacterized protein n=1 Tax=Marinobacter vulgaris TaxID=1928331 RepID=A0A2V4A0D3_9GAMM|nr:DUF6639 family protein [Marinobacter vulgaris]PXX91840.1 hypothetical protein DIT71_08280 [Marinobacter vulgaris]TSJ70652.1 hypothetical protein FPC41_07090 [Marinobacter vulgaris]